MPINSYSDGAISPRTNVYAADDMLETAKPVMVLEKVAKTKQMPKNKTDTIVFRRPRVFDAATTPLQEGVTPTSTVFGYDDYSATLRQYGMVVEITDKIADTHEDPVIQDAAVQCGLNIGRTMEALNFGVARGGTNVFYANGTARTSVNTPITRAKQHAVTRGLKAQKAQKISRILSGSQDYATRPIEAAYIGIGHTDLEYDIRNLAGFIPVAEYGQRSPISDFEIGSVEDVRYILSPDLPPFDDAGGAKGTMISASGTNADVYPILYFGQDAFAMVALRGYGAVSASIIPPGKIEKVDPLGQRGMVSWKTYHAAVILSQVWMARLEVAATDL